MTGAAGNMMVIAMVLALGGAALLVWVTARALRPRRPGESFAWVVLAGMAYSLLALAAEVRDPQSGGLRAAVAQLLAVALAAAIGGLTPTAREEAEGEAARGGLGTAALFLAWLSLIGLPPTAGFHSKVLVYRALLAADWGWLAALGMAGSAAALAAGFLSLGSTRPAPLRGLRAVVVFLLAAALVLVGLYPQAGLIVAMPLAGGG